MQKSICCKAEILSSSDWRFRHKCKKCGRHIGTSIYKPINIFKKIISLIK